MKPTTHWSIRVVLLSGIILAFVVVAIAQTPQLPSQAPSGPPGQARPQGPPPAANPPCGQNRLTAQEQLQNGASISDIIQQENRVVS